MFHLLQKYFQLQVFYLDVAYIFTYLLQVYILDVSSVFRRMLHSSVSFCSES
jgi:hypothetical protein